MVAMMVWLVFLKYLIDDCTHSALVPSIRLYRQHQRLDHVLPLILKPHITPTPIPTRTAKPHCIIHLAFGPVPCRSSQSATNPLNGIQHLCIRYSPTHFLFLDGHFHSPSLVASRRLCNFAANVTACWRATYRLLELDDGRGELQYITLTASSCGLPIHPAYIAANYLYLFLDLAPALPAI